MDQLEATLGQTMPWKSCRTIFRVERPCNRAEQMGTSRQIPNDFIYVRTRLSHTFFLLEKHAAKWLCERESEMQSRKGAAAKYARSCARRSANDFQFQS